MPALGDWCREGDGVLKTLPAWLFFWWRLRMQQKTIAAMIRAAPMSDPITMPAMAPPEIPEPESRPQILRLLWSLEIQMKCSRGILEASKQLWADRHLRSATQRSH